MIRPLSALVFLLASTAAAIAQSPRAFSLIDAIHQAARTNPAVWESAANRRATEAELRQSQGTLLPQVRLQALVGPEMTRRYIFPEPIGNGDWQTGRDYSVIVRQVLFDGFSSINEIWRQAARVDAAALRVFERTELIALDATEAYIDVVRYLHFVALARDNLLAHRRILQNVQARFDGGRSGDGDLQQARERLAAAEAVAAEFKRNLEDARAKYRKVIGLEPYHLRFPGRLLGLPRSKDESLAVTLRANPTIRAAGADFEAARYGFNATAGAFVPNLALEARAFRGWDSSGYLGKRDEFSAKLVVTWDIFRGGQDAWTRVAAAERMIEQSERHARLQRDAVESIDKAWAARTITSERAAALVRQADAARRALIAYTKEYELGQRTLLNLLDAENQLFNALLSLVSTRGVAVFADYQLLAAMGQLTSYLKAPQPAEAERLETRPFGVFPIKLPPILLDAPALPEPYHGAQPLPYAYGPGIPAAAGTLRPMPVMTADDRWPDGSILRPPERLAMLPAPYAATVPARSADRQITRIDDFWPQERALAIAPTTWPAALLGLR